MKHNYISASFGTQNVYKKYKRFMDSKLANGSKPKPSMKIETAKRYLVELSWPS